jgi:hypothetical protein
MRYEIDENNAIHMWNDSQEEPFLFQPDWPDGTPWADAKEAEDWAKAKIAELQDPTAYEAPVSRGAAPVKQYRQIRAEQQEAMKNAIAKLVELGLTVEEATAIAGRDI